MLPSQFTRLFSTLSIHPADTSPLNREHVQKFGQTMKTVRMLVNTPASQGAIGDIYSEGRCRCRLLVP